ncbi:MAG: aromatic ring hydroxylase [Bacillota bacterium]|nr:MAG: aromatic ring hydroxylase [Bacillota bacterium]
MSNHHGQERQQERQPEGDRQQERNPEPRGEERGQEPQVGVETVREALMDVIDPELGFNVVDLGLVYGIRIDGRRAEIIMTMTTPGCPATNYLEEGARSAALSVPGIEEVDVKVVWSPPWTPDMMSDRAKQFFGLA